MKRDIRDETPDELMVEFTFVQNGGLITHPAVEAIRQATINAMVAACEERDFGYNVTVNVRTRTPKLFERVAAKKFGPKEPR